MISLANPQAIDIEDYLGQIRSHRRRGITLAAQLMSSAEQLKHTGRFLSDELLQQHSDWKETWIQLREQACCDESIREFLPENPIELDMCQLERALKHGLEICQRRQVERDQGHKQHLEALQSILDLTSSGDPKPLAQLQERAQSMQAKLLEGEFIPGEQMRIYHVLWQLVLDARDGRIDEPASLDRAVQINQEFDLLLTLQIVRGQIRRKSEVSKATTTPRMAPQPVPAVEQQRNLTIVSAPAGKAADAVPPRLELSTRKAVDLQERQVLEQVRDLARKHANSVNLDLLAEDKDLDVLATQCLADAADYILEVFRELPQGQPTAKMHLQRGVQFFSRGISAVRSTGAGVGSSEARQLQSLRWLQSLIQAPGTSTASPLPRAEVVTALQLQQLKKEIAEDLYELRRPRRINRILDRIQRRLLSGDLSPELNLERWQQIVADVDELIQDEQVTPCHQELHEVLAGHVDQMPSGLVESRCLRKVLAAIDRFAADKEADDGLRQPLELSPKVQQAAKLLAGRKVILIGGAPRPRTREWIQKSLGLSELIWETVGEHEATLKFQQIVQAPDVAAVLILVRWVGHGHADDIRTYCLQVRRPYVTVVKGYRLEQLAHEILQQRGDELQSR